MLLKFLGRSAAKPISQSVDETAYADMEVQQLRQRLNQVEQALIQADERALHQFSFDGDAFPGFAVKLSCPSWSIREVKLDYATIGITTILGITPHSLKGDLRLMLDSLSSTDRFRLMRHWSRSSQNLQSFSLELQLSGRGQEAWIQLFVSPQVGRSRLSWECVAMDVTSVHVAQKQAVQRHADRLDLLARVNTQIRSPLNAIMGQAQLLQSDIPENPSIRQGLAGILNSCRSLTQELDEVIDLVSLESGRVNLTPRAIDLREIVHRLSATIEVGVKDTGLAYAQELTPNTVESTAPPCWVSVDPARLQQVLSSLITAIQEFAVDGQLTLRYDHQIKQGHVHASFWIEHHGKRIDAPQPNGINERLLVCQALALQLGGSIGASLQSENKLAVGFRIALKTVTAPVTVEAVHQAVHPLTVLVVDDSVTNRIIMRKFLEKSNHTVYEAQNGQEAIQLLQQRMVDLTFMDIDMPLMSGLDATRYIRGNMPECAEMYVSGMSGLTRIEDQKSAIECGMNDYVTKPFDFQSLNRVVQAVQQRMK